MQTEFQTHQQPQGNLPCGEILIVEDSRTQRELLRYTLEEHGFKVTASGDGREALEMLGTFRPDLVISDIIMPHLDGLELCRQIKSSPRLKQTPVILLTALNDPKDVLRGLACGADSFIVKPFQEHDLLGRIESVVAPGKHEETGTAAEPLEINLEGEQFQIAADRRQILNFLLAAYGAAIDKNAQLGTAQEQLQAANVELENKVRERTASLEQAYKALESFSYSIAHDLRAPLRTIQGFTSLLLKEYAGTYDTKAKDFSQRVIHAAERMDQLIQDLLTYGRISQADFPIGNVSLQRVLDSVLQQFADEARQRGAEIQVQTPLPEVRGNQTLLEQVLVNLISNALKFAERPHVPGHPDSRGADASGCPPCG